MTPSPDSHPFADLVPDEPAWIDLKGLLLTGRCDVWAASSPDRGFVARSWDFPFAAVYGEPGAAGIRTATDVGRAAAGTPSATEEFQLLAPLEARVAVEAALPGWRRRGIALHRWAGSLPRELGSETEIRLLAAGHREAGLSFDLYPQASRHELELPWVSRRPIAVAIVDSRPVASCYAAFTTETLWDVAIETTAPYRRRRLATACFLTLAAHMAERGKAPVWGAMLDNAGSLGLAARLGFERQALVDGWVEA